MQRNLLQSLAIVAFAASSTVAAAQEGPPGKTGTFFQRGSEGWFWYEKKPEPPEEPEPEKAPPPPPVASAPPPQPQPQPMQYPSAPPAAAAPPPGSVAWLRQAIPAALDAATDNPTNENVERYFLLQKQAMDKSESFAEVASIVTTGHPELDEGRRRPRQDQYAKLLEEAASKEEAVVLKSLFQRAALVMFIDRNCSGCSLMAENFVRMQSTHGLVWQAVSLDGVLLPENLSDKQSFDNGIAEELGVQQGGAVFLVAPPDLYVPVTWNATGGSEIANRIMMVAYRSRLITEDEYHSTQPVNPMIGGAVVVKSERPDILRQADEFLNSRGQHVSNR